MIVLRRRYIFWLLKAYVRKWNKSLFLSFVIGLSIFYLVWQVSSYVLRNIPIWQKEYIGSVGVYSIDTLPQYILLEVSSGLTVLGSDGIPLPGLARLWKIEDGGKKYTFYLDEKKRFTDGSRVTANTITFSFSDVEIQKSKKDTIILTLKDPYSPLLVTISRPVFKKGFIGTGEYRITDIKLNGNFIQSLTLASVKNPYRAKSYHFYPSQEALKMGFAMGEVSKAVNVSDSIFKSEDFSRFPHVQVIKKIDYDRLVTLFYNTKDTTLSDEKLRNALSYSIPNTFSQGERNRSPFPQKLWAYTDRSSQRSQDIEHAKKLFFDSQTASKSGQTKLTIKTLSKYKTTAGQISTEWVKLNIETRIEVVESIPEVFQIYLGDFYVPKDPDQYSLWHSNQPNNITGYKNLRIDKLLEDGRKTDDKDKRKKIYNDFQKYILDDSPATFLYFPYIYDIVRN